MVANIINSAEAHIRELNKKLRRRTWLCRVLAALLAVAVAYIALSA